MRSSVNINLVSMQQAGGEGGGQKPINFLQTLLWCRSFSINVHRKAQNEVIFRCFAASQFIGQSRRSPVNIMFHNSHTILLW